jgi:tetratricopeptide (TPR) repeat protein
VAAASPDGWYLSDAWDVSARDLFESKLARSRSSRAHYLYAKGLALVKTDDGMRVAAGRDLLLRALAAAGVEELDASGALYGLGDSFAREGRYHEAEEYLRACLAMETEGAAHGRRFSHYTELRLAEVLVAEGQSAKFDEAWDLLNAAAERPVFNSQIWRAEVARARIQASLGVVDAAARHAALALAALAQPSPQFPRHPNFGALETDEPTRQEMVRLAG